MARIAGIDLPRDKRIEIALTYIFGIGRPTAQKLLGVTGVSPDIRVKDLTDEDIQKAARADRKGPQGRRRSAARDRRRDQAADGHRLLPRHPPSSRSAGARSADEDEFPHAQRSEEDGRGQEEGQRARR